MKNYFEFLNKSVTPYHAVANIKAELLLEGYVELFESESWQVKEGGKYFVCRNGSSIIAFVKRAGGFLICASHSDFPALAVKGTELVGENLKLDVEKYGGSILYSWLDRPLGVAGRAVISTDNGVEIKLVDMDEQSVIIPSVAIHMRRDVNDGCKLSPAKDMLPLASICGNKSMKNILADRLGIEEKNLLSYDLRLYNKDKACEIGFCSELVCSPRIDNLTCAYASLKAFLTARTENTPVVAVFDNEEVGSSTKQGANSSFLRDVLSRISDSEEDYCKRLASSFMVSADNAHAQHPNYPELADKENAPKLNGGVVVKYNSNQAYATDALSDGIFRSICNKAGVKLQKYYNRADMLGGSTLGSISNTKVSIPTIDIGIPQLAMHSSMESCAKADVIEMEKALSAVYNSTLIVKSGKIEIK